jgi:hypothetical protein
MIRARGDVIGCHTVISDRISELMGEMRDGWVKDRMETHLASGLQRHGSSRRFNPRQSQNYAP